MGLNEAMTEYLTQIRNEKFETNYSDLISGYRTIVEQIRRLISIIGEKKIIRCYFHNPDSLKELLKANKMNYDVYYEDFIEWAFSFIIISKLKYHHLLYLRNIHYKMHYFY